MNGENGLPITPDWLPESPRCTNHQCHARESYCRFKLEKYGTECCPKCSHALNGMTLPKPAGWVGGEN